MRILYPFDIEDVDQAEAENALRDHDAAMSRINRIATGVREAQGKLLESIGVLADVERDGKQSRQLGPHWSHGIKSMGHGGRKGTH
jgi:hypothetical protein